MEFIYNNSSIHISDDDINAIDRLIENKLITNSVWMSIDPYDDMYITGNKLQIFAKELEKYELYIKEPYYHTINSIRKLAEQAYLSGGTLFICGD